MNKRFLLGLMMGWMVLGAGAQSGWPEKAPELEFALQLKVTLGETFGIDNTQHGRRTVIPITGGTFEGPKLKGTIVNGGADYQLNGPDGRTELEAIYCIKTDDGVYIHVRNRGIIANGKDAAFIKENGCILQCIFHQHSAVNDLSFHGNLQTAGSRVHA